MNIDDIDIGALETSVGLLDALIEGAAAALPGVTADHYARDLRRLGDGAAQAAAELEALRPRRRRGRRAA
ncbi:MAG: hypothetical protein Q7J32_04545 [Sphingomonadaceae bacterium]|nr:hypothetical protein [Sphingomonadaceae bacterium]